MKQSDFMEVMATWADAEARSTATLIELVTAAVVMKVSPKEAFDNDCVITAEISQADLEAVVRDFHFETQYDEHGTMTMFLTRIARKD